MPIVKECICRKSSLVKVGEVEGLDLSGHRNFSVNLYVYCTTDRRLFEVSRQP